MRRDIIWEMLPARGLEHLSLEIEEDAISAAGVVVADFGSGSFRLRYTVLCGADWIFSAADLRIEQQGSESRGLSVRRHGSGEWLVDGHARADLAGCTDIDIMASPFTNTLPLRRLTFVVGQPQRIRVAYIKVPDLTVSAEAQEYTRLAEGEPRRFRYRGLGTDFVADVDTDADGLVLDYGEIWRRRSG